MGLQIRQGTDAQRLTITPQSGELIYTTDTGFVYVGDGVTLGGIPVSGGGGSGYGNLQVAAYLPTYTGNLVSLEGNIATTASIRANNVSANNIGADYFVGDGSLLTNINSANIIGTYGNANVAAYMPTYLPTYTGRIGGGNAVAIGGGAGETNQDTYTVAIGDQAGQVNQGQGSIAIGSDAGNTNQGDSAIAIGLDAGQQNQGNSATAVGNSAGFTNQSEAATAVGISAGETTQGFGASAFGGLAGQQNQGELSVAVGGFAGQTNQGNNAVAIGAYAGNLTQGNNSVAIGNSAGSLQQGPRSVAIGDQAGYSGLAENGIAIGTQSFANSVNTVAIGTYAGQNSASANVIAIGYGAGQRAGNNSICIGAFIEDEAQSHQNSIVLNAQSNTILNTFTPGFFVNPVRNDSGNTNAQMFYNQSTAEITWSKVSSLVKTPVRAASTVSLSTLSASGYFYYNGPNNDGVNATIVQEFVSPFTGPLVIDGVTLRAGDRVLLKDEVGTSAGGVPPGLLTGKNGIYVVTDPGNASLPWRLIRAQDFNEPADIPNSLIYVEEGVQYGRTSFRNLNSSYNPIVIGTTDLIFTLENTVRSVVGMTSNYPGYSGQLLKDSNYLYVCMSQNSWMRIPLQSF